MKAHTRVSATLSLAFILSAGLATQAQVGSQGYALSFAGANFVQVPDNPSLTPSQFTFEAWVKINSAGCNTIISRGDGNTPSTDYIFQVGYDGTNCGVM